MQSTQSIGPSIHQIQNQGQGDGGWDEAAARAERELRRARRGRGPVRGSAEVLALGTAEEVTQAQASREARARARAARARAEVEATGAAGQAKGAASIARSDQAARAAVDSVLAGEAEQAARLAEIESLAAPVVVGGGADLPASQLSGARMEQAIARVAEKWAERTAGDEAAAVGGLSVGAGGAVDARAWVEAPGFGDFVRRRRARILIEIERDGIRLRCHRPPPVVFHSRRPAKNPRKE
jgi:hypothetical protein